MLHMLEPYGKHDLKALFNQYENVNMGLGRWWSCTVKHVTLKETQYCSRGENDDLY